MTKTPREPFEQVLTHAQITTMSPRPRHYLLNPVLPEKGLGILWAPTGYGKSLLAMAIGHAVATGGTLFGRWTAPQPRRVLYIDGEMDDVEIDWRVKALRPATEMFGILSPDYMTSGPLDLTTHEGRSFVERAARISTARGPTSEPPHTALLILDNISTLAGALPENESSAWPVMQNWFVSLRRIGVAVLAIHHTGKSGDQRGTNKKLDVLNLALALKRPPGYVDGEDNCRFVVEIKKGRHIHGEARKPFEASFRTGADGEAIWTAKAPGDARVLKVRELIAEGKSLRQISGITGWSKSLVHKLAHESDEESEAW